MYEIDDAARAMHKRHPHFRPKLRGRHFSLGIVDVRAFYSIPDDSLSTAPLHQPVNTLGHPLIYFSVWNRCGILR